MTILIRFVLTAFYVTPGLVLLVQLPGCTRNSGVSQPAIRQDLSPMEAMGMLKNDFAVLIDVREERELADGMAQPAKWFPYSRIEKGDEEFKKFIAQLPRDKQILFYCAAGGRAQKVAEQIAAEGRPTANLGGFKDWKKAGLPVRPGP